MYGGTKPAQTTSDSSTYNLYALVLIAILWKAVMACVHIYLMFLLIRSLFQHKKIEHKVGQKVQWLDCFLVLDLVWSGIPLGVITALELFYFERDHLLFDAAQNFELLKLAALTVDLIGLSYLIWFVIFGLSNERQRHHDVDSNHNPHHINGHGTAETTPILNKVLVVVK